MHGFPKNEGNLQNAWIKFVQKHRLNWQPSPYPTLCSAHFEPRFYLQQQGIGVIQLDPGETFQTKRWLDRKVVYLTIDTVEPERQSTTISPRERRQVRTVVCVIDPVVYFTFS